jgi:hypothetical protein
MKSKFAVGIAAIAIVPVAILFLNACASRPERQTENTSQLPNYDTVEEIRSMPQCQAVVVRKAPCHAYLETTRGTGFYLGSPAIGAEIGRFIKELRIGDRYELPDAFAEHARRQRNGR